MPHTSGPWVADTSNLPEGVITIHEQSVSGTFIATVTTCWPGGEVPEEEQLPTAYANASLIAASPALLEAVLEFTRRDFDPQRAFTAARAALIKAIGQEGYEALGDRIVPKGARDV